MRDCMGVKMTRAVSKLLMDKLTIVKTDMRKALSHYPQFEAPQSFEHLKNLVKGYVGYGNKMGEGWLLTGEMIELINEGVPNIVCTQPFWLSAQPCGRQGDDPVDQKE